MRQHLTKITRADWFPVAVAIVLAVFQFGWLLFPALGTLISLINGAVIAGIVIAAIISRLLVRREPNK